jgi:hypothetical protein
LFYSIIKGNDSVNRMRPTHTIRTQRKALLSFISLFLCLFAGPIKGHTQETTVPVLDELALSLQYQSDGTIRVSQSYVFSDEAEIPDFFSTWIRDSRRRTLFHHAFVIVNLRVTAAADMPINFEIERTSDGFHVEVDDPKQHFSIGRELHVHYTIVGGFDEEKFTGDFFDNESLEGWIRSFSLHVRDQETGVLSLINFDHQLVSKGNVVPMSVPRDLPRHKAFTSTGVGLAFPVALEVLNLEASGGSQIQGLSTSLQRFLFTNSWLFAPFILWCILALLAWVLSRERIQKKQVYSQRPKPPEGMDPGTMAVLLHGGVSARYFAAVSLWLANRGKLMLEYRPGKKHGRSGMVLSKKTDLDSATREHERYIWNNVLFQGVESMSLERLRTLLKKGRNRARVRGVLSDFFPHRYALRRPKVLEWWLWPKTYLFIGVLILLLGLAVVGSMFGLFLSDLHRWEWFLGFPLLLGGLLFFMSKADWTQHQPEDTDRDLMSFVAFLEQPPEKLKEIAGDQKALSILLPYAVACGTERNILDLYCSGKRKVFLPSWFIIYGNTTEEIHVHEVKAVLSDFVEGMLDVF